MARRKPKQAPLTEGVTLPPRSEALETELAALEAMLPPEVAAAKAGRTSVPNG